MSDMHLLAAAKSLLSHPPFTLADAEPWRRWKRKLWGRRGSASPRYGTSPRAGGRGSQTLSPGGWLSGFRVGGQQ
jgi:hypothetical protein